MKKLIIAAAIVCAAALSHAAAINWSTGGLKDHTGATINKSNAYTATVYFFSDAAGENDISESKFGPTLTDTSSTKQGEYSAQIASPSAASGTYYAKVIITDGEWTLASGIASFTFNPEAISDLNINFQTGTGLSGAVLNNTGTNYGWQAVPEPTSGLLLLLGVAGLALKRKRA